VNLKQEEIRTFKKREREAVVELKGCPELVLLNLSTGRRLHNVLVYGLHPSQQFYTAPGLVSIVQVIQGQGRYGER
jgi:hypothetical protein